MLFPNPRIIERTPISIALLACIPAVFFSTLVVGAVRWYAATPFWDMWDGYLGDYLLVLDGHWFQALFRQANDHRIVFSKLLFWLDLRYFGGRSVLLVPANIALAAAVWLSLCAIGKRLIGARTDLWLALALSLAAPCFSWMQNANIFWGFQSQWFFAYLFPLLAFACLAMSTDGPRRSAWFMGAMAFGLASLGAMANGLFAFPLLFVMQILLDRWQWRRLAVIGAVGGAGMAAWCYHYTIFGGPPHVSVANFIDFVLELIGAPFIRAFHSLTLGYACAALFIAATLALTVRWFRQRDRRDPMALGLLIFIGYIGLSAAAMALGRAGLGGQAALTERYATPSLLAWAALAILAVNAFKARAATRSVCVIAGLAAAFMLLPAQLEVFNDDGPKYTQLKTQAALALKLGAMDVRRIGAIYPVDNSEAQRETFFGIVRRADGLGLSIFGGGELARAVSFMGKPAESGFHACTGKIEAQVPISGEARFTYATGWAYDSQARRVPPFAYLASANRIMGVVVTGQPRPDVAASFRRTARYGGFGGYVTAANDPLTVLCANDDQ